MRRTPGHGGLERCRTGCGRWLFFFVTIVVASLSSVVGARQVGPVYPDDSVAAREGLSRAKELAQAGNLAEAVRVVQSVLTVDGDRVLESPTDADLFVSVRSRAHALLLENAVLLAKYREIEGPEAQRELDLGEIENIERARLMTRAGFEAALRLAQEHLESARFEAARLTLGQLEAHPDRRGDAQAGKDAAKLAIALARYLPREDVRELAARWAAESGVKDEAGAPVAAPAAAAQYSPYSRALPEATMQGLIPRPIQSVWMSQDAQEDAATAQANAERRSRQMPLREPSDDAWTLPTVRADVVYTNDGRSIGAWDRFTLQPLWRVTPSSQSPGEHGNELLDAAGRFQAEARAVYRNGTVLEDADTVTLAGPLVVATTGLAGRDGRDGDPRTHAIDAATGRVLWSVSPTGQDVQLAQAFVRGPALIEGDSVVLALRKPSNTKRIAATFLVSLDLWTGKLRWSRLLGSAGWIFNAGVRTSDIPILDKGIVYKADDIGVIAAVEAWSGRVSWVRRFRSETRMRADSNPPWSGAIPVMDGETLIAISPTREDVLRLNARTGAIVGSRKSGEMGEPLTLVRFGSELGAVGVDQIVLAPVATFESASLTRAPLPKDSKLRGRPVAGEGAAGPFLLVPLADGLMVLNSEGESVQRVAIETPGNTVVVGSHAIVADKGKLHSYLVWDEAESLLKARMEKNPSDPRPGITLAELAYRSGREGLIAPASDKAIDAIVQSVASPESGRARKQLLSTLMGMVAAARDTWPGAEEPARESRDPVLGPPVLEQVLARVERLAESPQERADYFMSLGRFSEALAQGIAGGKPELAAGPRAVEAYQHVLEDSALGASVWNASRGGVRAEIEATRRVREIVSRLGRGVYKVFDEEAQREAVGLATHAPGAARAAEFETMARRYPASVVAPALWTMAAEDYERAGQSSLAMGALGAGLDSAEWCVSVGEPRLRGSVGELGGRLVRLLEKDERVSAAAQLVDRLARDHPGLALTVGGTPIDPSGTLEDLKRRIAGLARRARIGTQFGSEVQAIPGWTIVRPLSEAARGRATEHVMLHSKSRHEVALWGASEDGSLKQLWTRAYEGTVAPQLVTLDAESAYLFWPVEEGGSLERIGAVGGETRWKTPNFGELFPTAPDEEPARVRTIQTPLDGAQRSTNLLLAMDDQTAVVAERSGRVAAFDMATGRTLWAQPTVIEQVFDLMVGPGAGAGPGQSAVVIAGMSAKPGIPGERFDVQDTIAAYDARSGKLMQQMSGLGGNVHWVRPTPAGGVIAGLEQKVLSLNLPEGRANWELIDSSSRLTSAGWVVGDRLFVMASTGARQMWLVSASSGGPRRDLDPKGRVESSPRYAILGQGGDADVAFLSRRGVAVFGPTGELIGLDPLNGATEVLPAEVGEGLMAMVEAGRSTGSDAPTAKLHILENRSARMVASVPVVMHEDPKELMIIDGHVLISSDSVTLVIQATAPKK